MRWKWNPRLIGLVIVGLIVSCAGLPSKPTAQSEFDRGLSLFNRGKYDQAATLFARATELKPDFGQAYLYLGRSYLNMGKWREALPPLRTAFRLSPEESKGELVNLLLDFLLQHASKLDPDTLSEFEDIFRQK